MTASKQWRPPADPHALSFPIYEGPNVNMFNGETDGLYCSFCGNFAYRDLYNGPAHDICKKCRHTRCMHGGNCSWCDFGENTFVGNAFVQPKEPGP